MLVVPLYAYGNYVLWRGIIQFARLRATFTITPTHLIAVRPSYLIKLGMHTQQRLDLAWDAISHVRKLRRRRHGGPFLSQIETTDGTSISVGTHLLDYDDFIAELKQRAVNCRTFDPYLEEID
jgi:hypothetical protein